jgi:hypothetical protein
MNVRRITRLTLVSAALFASATPAVAWWQFVALGPNGERQVSPRYKTEKECNIALKDTEAKLEKRYPNPDRFPLVGSCEEYR